MLDTRFSIPSEHPESSNENPFISIENRVLVAFDDDCSSCTNIENN